MGIEIERKFLPKPDFELSDISFFKVQEIKQAYLSTDKNLTIRVRLKDAKAFITIKGINKGWKRSEYEYEIPYSEGIELMEMSSLRIEKKRYLYLENSKIWEIDIFEGNLAGLVLVEVEMESENEDVLIPSWVGKEVSEDIRFTNSYLAAHGYEKEN